MVPNHSHAKPLRLHDVGRAPRRLCDAVFHFETQREGAVRDEGSQEIRAVLEGLAGTTGAQDQLVQIQRAWLAHGFLLR